ncbi:MAG: metallophosphoesterase [Planctomycetota bacterium]
MRASRYLILLFMPLSLCAYGNDSSSAPDGSRGFAVEPYLLDVTDNSATVAFHLNEPMSAKVIIRNLEPVREFTSQASSKSHFVRITALESGRAYDYQVICGDGEPRTPKDDDSLQIRTACRDGETFTFAVYGDTRPGETKTTRYHREVVEQMILHEPAFCLALGDMVDDGEQAQLWQEFFHVESRLLRSSAIYPVVGDNDYAQGKGIFADFFPKLQKGYYKFEWGGVHFFGLHAWDTKGRQRHEELDSESPQIRWLESQLSKQQVRNAAFRVVFLHDPVYISRGRSSELLRRVWAPIFQKYGVDVVFSSWHLYERSRNEVVTYVVSGGGGAELIWMDKDPTYPSQAEARRHHFCRVDVGANAMTIRAIAADGTVLDDITLTPRTNDQGAAKRIERAARRLGKEIIINEQEHNPVIPLYLFSYDCSQCRTLVEQYLPDLAEENQITLKVFYFDVGIEGVYELFLIAEAEFGRQGVDIPAVFIGRSALGGQSEIEATLPSEIDGFFRDPDRYVERTIVPFERTHDTLAIKDEAFKALTYAMALRAGLLDGVSGCALTAVIFLVSYLILIGRTRKQIFGAGVMFLLAALLTYLVLALAFFNFEGLLGSAHLVAGIVNSLLLLLVAALAGFCMVDFARSLKGGVTDPAVRLPAFLRAGMQQTNRDSAKNKIALPAISVVSGVIIAAGTLACTGKVYIMIVTMLLEPRYRIAATACLVVYNVALMLPALTVLLLAAFGVTANRVRASFARHVPAVKVSLTVLFLVMAMVVIGNLRWLL